MNTPPDQIDLSHWTGHVLSAVAWLGALMGIFPAIAGLAALVWYIIQIYESKTFRRFCRHRRMKKYRRRRAEALNADWTIERNGPLES